MPKSFEKLVKLFLFFYNVVLRQNGSERIIPGQTYQGYHCQLHTLVDPDPSKPGHCPGKIQVNCGHCLQKLVVAPPHVLPAQVTWQL